MFIRLVDYVANLGGGVRFAVELAGALASKRAAEIEIVSHGGALERYREHVLARGIPAQLKDVAPRFVWRTQAPGRMLGIPGTGRMAGFIGAGRRTFWELPARVLDGCDVLWLPWVHRHSIPRRHFKRVVASFHDTILIDFPLPGLERLRKDERRLSLRYVNSKMRVVVSSQNTASCLSRICSAPLSNVDIVPVSGLHMENSSAASLPAEWLWTDRPFILCPSNIMPHKNLAVLFRGYAASSRSFTLVLTGPGTDLNGSDTLSTLACRLGLSLGRDLIGLGFVTDEIYRALMQRAAALVMPTLAEGGGSFPVAEALWSGIPVIASDIPVLREQAELMGAEVLWFDPRKPAELAARLTELENDYPAHKRRFTTQVARLNRRSWHDVADDYMTIFSQVAGR